MTTRPIEFLVPPTSSAPRSLPESIRQVGNLSAGFCRSWNSSEIADAHATSEEAFQLLDHIQNELLRRRDERAKLSTWPSDQLKTALDATVGDLLDPASPNDKTFFLNLPPGAGALPTDASLNPLTLAVALNKLKHRSTSAVNFTASATGTHALYIFTNAGMGKPDTISSFDIHVFCSACKVAANAI